MKNFIIICILLVFSKSIYSQNLYDNTALANENVKEPKKQHEFYKVKPLDQEMDVSRSKTPNVATLQYFSATSTTMEQQKFLQNLPKSCADSRKAGIQLIELPYSGVPSFLVTCDASTQNGGWTVIQRRIDGSVDFQRSWSEYENGFGNLDGEFFIGLKKIHLMSSYEKQELLILLEDFNNVTKYATYSEFEIGSEAELYALKNLGEYSGTAGDSLSYHKLQKFSTYDRDNDQSTINCAKNYKGGWWYNSCVYSNLNGHYLKGKYTASYARGTAWYHFNNTLYNSLKSVTMLIRATPL